MVAASTKSVWDYLFTGSRVQVELRYGCHSGMEPKGLLWPYLFTPGFPGLTALGPEAKNRLIHIPQSRWCRVDQFPSVSSRLYLATSHPDHLFSNSQAASTLPSHISHLSFLQLDILTNCPLSINLPLLYSWPHPRITCHFPCSVQIFCCLCPEIPNITQVPQQSP